MISIIAGTNRPQSRSLEVAKLIQSFYEEFDKTCVFDLSEAGLQEVNGSQYSENKPKAITEKISKVNESRGLVMVCPEYNGSMPGALKYFIDHWNYPESLEFRPVTFIGLGGMFGGLRPVEHLQQIFGYRNAFIYPERVFLINIWDLLKDEELKNKHMQMLKTQAEGFCKYIKALESENLTANLL